MKRSTHLLYFLFVSILFTSCTNRTSFYEENIAIKLEMTEFLQTITDAGSAEAAMPELEKLEQRHLDWLGKIKDVVFTVEDYEKHRSRHEPAIKGLGVEFERVKGVLSGEDELQKKITRICKLPLEQ